MHWVQTEMGSLENHLNNFNFNAVVVSIISGHFSHFLFS